MAAYPTITPDSLAGFTGRPIEDYPDPFTAASAIPQAILLFRLATGRIEWPDDPDQAQLALFAVEQLADSFAQAQQYADVVASPFNSETIGSYTYQKALNLIQVGKPTGLFWFDLALQRLGISDDIGRVTSGSLSMFEHDLEIRVVDGLAKIIGPADENQIDTSMWSISRNIPYDPNGSR